MKLRVLVQWLLQAPLLLTPDHAESDVEGKDSEKSYDSDIDKETLCLGEPSPASFSNSSDEDVRDSQVSSGWLGRAYNRESRNAKREKAMHDLAQVWSLKLNISLLFKICYVCVFVVFIYIDSHIY